MFFKITPQRLSVYTDGSIRPEQGTSGLAAVVRDRQGKILYWWSRRAGRMTCNEAEYGAAILALESLLRLRVREVALYSDSQVMVFQMNGRARTHASGLKQAQIRVRALLVHFDRVTFHHIPREENRLADALANDTVDGRVGSHG